MFVSEWTVAVLVSQGGLRIFLRICLTCSFLIKYFGALYVLEIHSCRVYVVEIISLNPVERQRKEIIILKLYLYTKPILMQDGERLNLVISRHNTFKAVS